MAPEKLVHPIVAEAARLATPDSEGRIDFSDDALARLRKRLKALETNATELPIAVVGLVTFAAHIHRDCRSERGGIRLLDVAAEMAGVLRQRVAEMEMAQDAAAVEPTPKVNAFLDFLGHTDPRPSAAPEKRPGRSGLTAMELISKRGLNRKGVRT